MKIIHEDMSITSFEAWSGGEDTKAKILEENKEDEFDALIEEIYQDGLTATELNNILWHDYKWVFEQLGIEEEEEEEEESEETEGILATLSKYNINDLTWLDKDITKHI